MKQNSPSVEEIWRRYDDTEQRLSAPLSERMLDLAQLSSGMQVLDLATGRGEPALRAAKRIAPAGSVFGIDIAPRMLAMAIERADAEGIANFHCAEGNAESLEFLDGKLFDAILARWGLMYFSNPVVALTQARRHLKPGARFVAGYWSEPERVGYYSLPRDVLHQLSPLPPIDFEAPGTFRFATLDTIQRDYLIAGLEILSVEEMEVPVMEATNEDELLDWVLCFGMRRLLNELDVGIQKAWEKEFLLRCQSLWTVHNGTKTIRLGGITRIVVAKSTNSLVSQ